MDLDCDQLAGRRIPTEVRGRVPSGPAAQERRIGTARAFDEHLLDPPDAFRVTVGGGSLRDLDQALDPLALDLLGHLVAQAGGLRAGTRREDEGERAVVADLLDRFEGL